MTTLADIEAAARRLPASEKQQLLLLVAQILRAEGRPLPEPRQFTGAEMRGWMDEDDQDAEALRGEG